LHPDAKVKSTGLPMEGIEKADEQRKTTVKTSKGQRRGGEFHKGALGRGGQVNRCAEARSRRK